VGVRLPVGTKALTPSQNLSMSSCDLRAALSSTGSRHVEDERVLSQVEVSLGFQAKVGSPRVLEVFEEPPRALVSVIDATHLRKYRVALDTRIRKREHRVDVAGIEGLHGTAMELDILLGHAVSVLGAARGSAFAAAWRELQQRGVGRSRVLPTPSRALRRACGSGDGPAQSARRTPCQGRLRASGTLTARASHRARRATARPRP
jgi:hypothetical protein